MKRNVNASFLKLLKGRRKNKRKNMTKCSFRTFSFQIRLSPIGNIVICVSKLIFSFTWSVHIWVFPSEDEATHPIDCVCPDIVAFSFFDSFTSQSYISRLTLVNKRTRVSFFQEFSDWNTYKQRWSAFLVLSTQEWYSRTELSDSVLVLRKISVRIVFPDKMNPISTQNLG